MVQTTGCSTPAMDGIIWLFLLLPPNEIKARMCCCLLRDYTMTINRDIFAVDPTTRPIPNNGVAKVVEPSTPAEYDVLRYELSSFVCDGEYRQGMERILSA